MSYLVMARRWRPQRFEDVIAQSHVTRTLQQAIARGRVAHSYILTGPRGVGKTTTARILAKAINCTNLQKGADGSVEPCNECDACNDITSGSALDVIEIDGASNNKVEDVRTLRENIKFSPNSLRRKVYIIDEVHMLSVNAFNALLKTLEEPPEHAMFIFATTEIHKVPATVLSRCQRFDFKRISPKEIRVQLDRIVEGDSIAIDDDALTTISIRAEGALRDALSILDQLVAYQGTEAITGDVVRQALGMIGPELYFRATDLAATGEVATALQLADDLANGGYDSREFLKGFQRHILNLLQLRAGIPAEQLDVSEPFRAEYEQRMEQHTDEDLLRMGEWAAETEDLLREVLDPRVRMELFLVRLSRMDRAVDLAALLKKLGVEPGSFKEPVKKNETVIRQDVDNKKDSVIAEKKEETVAPTAKEKEVSRPAEPSLPRETTPPRPHTETDLNLANAPAQMDELPPPPEEPPSDFDIPPSMDEVRKDRGASSGSRGKKPVEPYHSDTGQNEDIEKTLNLSTLREKWLSFCDEVRKTSISVSVQLELGAPTSLDHEMLTIMFEDAFKEESVKKDIPTIQNALLAVFGVNRRIITTVGEIAPNQRPQRRITSREKYEQEFKENLEKNPVWKQMQQRFDLNLDD